MADSVFSSPARSWRDVRNGSLPDSDPEYDSLEYLSAELQSATDATVISGWLKFRDQKRWKLRWGVVTKLSPAADCLHLQLYRDSRDRYKQGLTKASLSLQHFLGLETGFTLDKESNTIAIICQDLIVVLAFDTRERLIQWQVKIYSHLGEDQQFLIQISSSPPKAKLSPGPAKLHIQERRFCLTSGVPPKLAGCWEIKHLRRFGVVDGKFCFEGGSLCGRGEGLYVFLTDQGEEITRSVQMASEGRLNSLRRPLMRNMSVQHESPRKGIILRTDPGLSEPNCIENCIQGSSSVHPNESAQPWPSMETQADVYGHGDTTSLADFPTDAQNIKTCNWNMDKQLGRCVSCIGKLGLISRPSTAANTPGSINFNPWAIDESNLCRTGIHHDSLIDELEYTCDSSYISISQKSKYSNSSSSGTECSEQPSSCQHSLLETSKIFQTPISPPKNFQSINIRPETESPPCRPPKPAKYRNQSTSNGNTPVKRKINKPPMPLPSDVDDCACKTPPPSAYDNYEQPKFNDSFFSHQKTIDFDSCNQYYDTPRSIKAQENAFANYDVPPTAVPLRNNCACSSKMKIMTEADSAKNLDICFCQQLLRYSQPWMQLPFHLPCKNYWQKLTVHKPIEHRCNMLPAKETPVYAKVDLSKKLKNRLLKESEEKPEAEEPVKADVDATANPQNYMNIRFDGEDENYKHLTNLNYMNLEFSNSLRYYENVRELLSHSKDRERIESLNIDLPAKFSAVRHQQPIRVCNKCGHACQTKNDDDDVDKSKPRLGHAAESATFENYVPMSPLKLGAQSEKSAGSAANAAPEKRPLKPLRLNTKYSTLDSYSKYADKFVVEMRKRSNSASSPENVGSVDSKDSDLADSRLPVDSDSGLESDKLSSQENDDTLETLQRHRKESSGSSGGGIVAGGIRRLSSIVCKSSNRDSSSSNDSGFSSASLKYPCQDFVDFEMPLTTAGSTKRHNSFNQHSHKNGDTNYSPTPRRAKSTDPLRDLAFQFHRGSMVPKSSSAEAELPLFLTKRDHCKDCTSPPETAVSVPYVECRSTSSGTSDMSDYIETLSISSHSSSDVHSVDAIRLHQSVVTTLKPRSGNEYQKVDRISLLDAEPKVKSNLNELKRNNSVVSDK